MRILDAALKLSDLAALNSNRLEMLGGDREGQYSIRINLQWRICFQWPEDQAGPDEVEIVDYHWELQMARTPIHPGEILADEIDSLGMSARQLADTLAIPSNRLYQIIAGKRNISADTALRLGRYFRMSPDFWMNLQSAYELDLARQASGKSIMKLPQRVA